MSEVSRRCAFGPSKGSTASTMAARDGCTAILLLRRRQKRAALRLRRSPAREEHSTSRLQTRCSKLREQFGKIGQIDASVAINVRSS